MTAGRDIFLDDDQSAAAVSAELEMLAREAKRTGVAIAIGHPHDLTLKLLAAWLARDHGVTLVPLDEAIRPQEPGMRQENALPARAIHRLSPQCDAANLRRHRPEIPPRCVAVL